MNDTQPTLPEFIGARLNEWEVLAGAASPSPWTPNAERDEVVAVDGITVCDGFALSGRQLRATVDHIAYNDPAMTLAVITAMRGIVEQAWFDAASWDGEFGDGCSAEEIRKCGEMDRWIENNGSLRALASIWKTHPDYPQMHDDPAG